MKNRVLACLIALAFLSLSTAWANDFSKVGTAGAQFLKIGPGARYIALGEASTAIVDDAYSLYWNPAALANLVRPEAVFTSTDWIDDVRLNYFAFAYPLNQTTTIACGATMLSMGETEITTVENPDGTGRTYDAGSVALTVGVARRLTDRFTFGVNFKYITEQIYEARSRGFAFDFGTLLYTGFRSLRLGMNISNLGPEMRFTGNSLDQPHNPNPDNPNQADVAYSYSTDGYDLPLMIRFGAAYDFFNNDLNRWTFTAEARDPSDNIGQFSFGSEYVWKSQFAVRAGYKVNYEEEGLTLGGGIKLNPTAKTSLKIDYAWADFGRLQSTHRFSLSLGF